MDHIRLPDSPAHPPIEVPYLCLEPYDNGPFSTYPLRQKWTQADLFFRPNWTRRPPFQEGSQLSTGRRSEEEANSFLQNWLFFGLLTTVFRSQTDVRDFVIRNVGGKDIITTARLFDRVSNLIESLQNVPVEVMQVQKLTIDRHLHLAHQVLSHICQNTTMNPAVLLSIAVLADFLAVIRNVLYWKGNPPDDELVFSWPIGDLSGNILTDRMSKDGWCKSQIIRSMRMSPSGQYFVSNLEKPPSEKDHSSCERLKCIAYQMDWDTYETKHITEKCKCGMAYNTTDSLVSILEKGRVPLISTTKPFREHGSLTLLEAQDDTRYVAISHVWSDRLGNLHANALPVCQLNHIAGLVGKLYPEATAPVPFWIDTICCPVKPRSARNQAIVLMRKTYLDADKVLVLDEYLRSHPAQGKSKFEPIARFFCSGWTQRLWTLQEGVLAKSLYVQFSDVAIDFQRSWLDLVRGNEQQAEFHNLLGFYGRIKGDSALKGSAPFYSIQNVVIALHERSTSVSTDEALCLGTLTGMELDKIVQALPEQRMKRFWSLQKAYTGELTFWTGHRLKEVGYRWAPASFLNVRLESLPGNSITNARSPAYLTDSGLCVKYPGLILGTITKYPVAQRSLLRDGNKQWKYWISCTAIRDETSETDLLEQYKTHQGKLLALILRMPIEDLDKGSLDMTDIKATLVAIKEQVGNIIYVDIIKTATIYLCRPGIIPANQLEDTVLQMELFAKQERESTQQEAKTTSVFILENHQHYLDVQEWLPPTQEWCLS